MEPPSSVETVEDLAIPEHAMLVQRSGSLTSEFWPCTVEESTRLENATIMQRCSVLKSAHFTVRAPSYCDERDPGHWRRMSATQPMFAQTMPAQTRFSFSKSASDQVRLARSFSDPGLERSLFATQTAGGSSLAARKSSIESKPGLPEIPGLNRESLMNSSASIKMVKAARMRRIQEANARALEEKHHRNIAKRQERTHIGAQEAWDRAEDSAWSEAEARRKAEDIQRQGQAAKKAADLKAREAASLRRTAEALKDTAQDRVDHAKFLIESAESAIGQLEQEARLAELVRWKASQTHGHAEGRAWHKEQTKQKKEQAHQSAHKQFRLADKHAQCHPFEMTGMPGRKGNMGELAKHAAIKARFRATEYERFAGPHRRWAEFAMVDVAAADISMRAKAREAGERKNHAEVVKDEGDERMRLSNAAIAKAIAEKAQALKLAEEAEAEVRCARKEREDLVALFRHADRDQVRAKNAKQLAHRSAQQAIASAGHAEHDLHKIESAIERKNLNSPG